MIQNSPYKKNISASSILTLSRKFEKEVLKMGLWSNQIAPTHFKTLSGAINNHQSYDIIINTIQKTCLKND